MKTFEFTVRLRGRGVDEDHAWRNAVEAFAADPGDPEQALEIEDAGGEWPLMPGDTVRAKVDIEQVPIYDEADEFLGFAVVPKGTLGMVEEVRGGGPDDPEGALLIDFRWEEDGIKRSSLADLNHHKWVEKL